MIEHETYLRVRYAETDQMGYCYYGNFAQYYEVGRAELIRSLGLSYRDMERDHGVLMPVMSLNIRYIRAAKYDDRLKLVTSLRKMPDRTVVFHTDIYNEEGKLVNGGTVKLSFISSSDHQSMIAPDFLLQKLAPYFETA
jgi:acyl-CoA thioester hydrolase